MFAYYITAELNNDGTYRVELYDLKDEALVVTTIERANITITEAPEVETCR